MTVTNTPESFPLDNSAEMRMVLAVIRWKTAVQAAEKARKDAEQVIMEECEGEVNARMVAAELMESNAPLYEPTGLFGGSLGEIYRVMDETITNNSGAFKKWGKT